MWVTTPQRILMLGATGYVGGRLAPRLLAAGHSVRCLARDASKLEALSWANQADLLAGDLLDERSLARAFDGIDVVYHLVHSMAGGADFAAADRRIARNVARAAAAAGVRRIVYLGGLGEDRGDGRFSEHLRSRAEVADVLLDGNAPVTVIRAGVIIGSGSASFEMLRYLVETLPVMVTPRWVRSRVQPIAIRDVLRCLIGVLQVTGADDHIFDIGGPDVLTYQEMMTVYAQAAGLPRRAIIIVPLLTPRLSSSWVGLVTPVPARIARPLVDGLVSDAVVSGGDDIARIVPGPSLSYRDAVRLALQHVRDHEIETSWREADLADYDPAAPYPGDPEWSGGTRYGDVRQVRSAAPADQVFAQVCAIGGEAGWGPFNWAWRVRGLLDRAIGGIGLRRGRRDPRLLRVGDALDFWRVVDLQAPRHDKPGLVRLRAEMKLPGTAWLEFRVAEETTARAGHGSGSVLQQRAVYLPRGLSGRLYWWAMVPFHQVIFPAMAASLVRRADRAVTSSDAPTGPRVGHGDETAAADPATPPARRAG